MSASAIALAMVTASCAAPAGRAPRVSAARDNLVRARTASSPGIVCPASTYPNGPNSTTPYAIAFKAAIVGGTINSGYNEDTGLPGTKKLSKGEIYTPWQLALSNITGEACGLLELPSLQIVVQPSGVEINGDAVHIKIVLFPFGPPAKLVSFSLLVQLLDNLAPAITSVLPTGQITAIAKDVSAYAVLSTAKNSPIYLDCPAYVTIPELTTETMRTVPQGHGWPHPPVPQQRPSLALWTMQGKPVTGPVVGATATLVSNDFQLGPFTPKEDPHCGIGGSFTGVFNNITGGINAQGQQYNPPVIDHPTIWKWGSPPGETQASLSIELTQIDLPALNPSPVSARFHA